MRINTYLLFMTDVIRIRTFVISGNYVSKSLMQENISHRYFGWTCSKTERVDNRYEMYDVYLISYKNESDKFSKVCKKVKS